MKLLAGNSFLAAISLVMISILIAGCGDGAGGTSQKDTKVAEMSLRISNTFNSTELGDALST